VKIILFFFLLLIIPTLSFSGGGISRFSVYEEHFAEYIPDENYREELTSSNSDYMASEAIISNNADVSFYSLHNPLLVLTYSFDEKSILVDEFISSTSDIIQEAGVTISRSTHFSEDLDEFNFNADVEVADGKVFCFERSRLKPSEGNQFWVELMKLNWLRKINLSKVFSDLISDEPNTTSSLQIKFPGLLIFSQLTDLDLSHNGLKTLPKRTERLPSLKLLNVVGNNISDFPELLKSKTGIEIIR
jgi:Leucine-rich repeat (LRR) protein